MKKHLFLATLLIASPQLPAEDIPDAVEPPALKRITGSEIIYYKFSKFDELNLPLEKIIFDYDTSAFKETKKLQAEGALTTLYYRIPRDASTLEVIRQYQSDLEPAGFEPLFTGANEALDDGFNRFVTQTFPKAAADPLIGSIHEFNSDEKRFTLLKGKNAAGTDVYVSIFAFKIMDAGTGTGQLTENQKLQKGETCIRIDFIETNALEERMTVVKAKDIENSLTTAGKIAIYGVNFDTDKAVITPESAESLTEMAKAINATPSDAKFLIVGHTDNQGSLDYNQKLSSNRAAAVVAELTSKYDVPGDKLIPVGVGMAAPVAPNTDANGQAKNRRVEIVTM